MTDEQIQHKVNVGYRRLAWRIFVYLKANPDILNIKNNQEVFDAVREIYIGYRMKATPQLNREEAEDFADLMSETEARFDGAKYFVDQDTMDMYRPDAERNKKRRMRLIVTSFFYDSETYTKDGHELALT